MNLCGVSIVGSGEIYDIEIDKQWIDNISSKPEKGSYSLHFDNAIAFPGLINSHDHLDFNCFPMLGNHTYNNYLEWGSNIHQENKAIIQEVLKIPKHLRTRWGIYKNLLNGITTVVNHGPRLDLDNDLITIYQNCYSLHSVQLEKRWRLKLNHPLNNRYPYVIHLGEGTDQISFEEINTLFKWNFLKKSLIGVHGVAMEKHQASKLTALIWCPYSNVFLLNKMPAIDQLKYATQILFGTDSTVSSSWNLWDHLSLANESGWVTKSELFDMLGVNAARIWNLNKQGQLARGMYADIIVAKRKKTNSLDAFFDLQPEDIFLVLHKGEVLLFDHSLKQQLVNYISTDRFSEIGLKGSLKFVKGNLPALIREIRKYYPGCEFPVEVS